jgi:hypothetical protein
MRAKRPGARTAVGCLLGAACSILLVTASASRAADTAPAAKTTTPAATSAGKPVTTAVTATNVAATRPAASPTAGGKSPTTPGVKPIAALDSTSGAPAKGAAARPSAPATGAAQVNAQNAASAKNTAVPAAPAKNAAAPVAGAKTPSAPLAGAKTPSPPVAGAKSPSAPVTTTPAATAATPTPTTSRPPRAGAVPTGPTPARLAATSKSQGVQNVAHLDQKLTYQYNALGRRDPFQPMVGGDFVGADVGGDAPVDIGGMKVVGIVWGTEDKFAMAEDGRGQSLVLRVGDKVMNGVVEGLRRDAVVVRITADGQSQSVAIPLTRKGDKSNATR